MSRFSIDSNRSPAAAASTTTRPSTTDSQMVRYVSRVSYSATNDTNTPTSEPTTKPSHVFPGESEGASLCRPNSRPAK